MSINNSIKVEVLPALSITTRFFVEKLLGLRIGQGSALINSASLEDCAIRFNTNEGNGKAVWKGKVLDTSQYKEGFIFVVNQRGRMFGIPASKKDGITHSSLFPDYWPSAAGYLETNSQGYITKINNNAKEFLPSEKTLDYLMGVVEKHNEGTKVNCVKEVSISDVEINKKLASDNRVTLNVQQYKKSLNDPAGYGNCALIGNEALLNTDAISKGASKSLINSDLYKELVGLLSKLSDKSNGNLRGRIEVLKKTAILVTKIKSELSDSNDTDLLNKLSDGIDFVSDGIIYGLEQHEFSARELLKKTTVEKMTAVNEMMEAFKSIHVKDPNLKPKYITKHQKLEKEYEHIRELLTKDTNKVVKMYRRKKLNNVIFEYVKLFTKVFNSSDIAKRTILTRENLDNVRRLTRSTIDDVNIDGEEIINRYEFAGSDTMGIEQFREIAKEHGDITKEEVENWLKINPFSDEQEAMEILATKKMGLDSSLPASGSHGDIEYNAESVLRKLGVLSRNVNGLLVVNQNMLRSIVNESISSNTFPSVLYDISRLEDADFDSVKSQLNQSKDSMMVHLGKNINKYFYKKNTIKNLVIKVINNTTVGRNSLFDSVGNVLKGGNEGESIFITWDAASNTFFDSNGNVVDVSKIQKNNYDEISLIGDLQASVGSDGSSHISLGRLPPDRIMAGLEKFANLEFTRTLSVLSGKDSPLFGKAIAKLVGDKHNPTVEVTTANGVFNVDDNGSGQYQKINAETNTLETVKKPIKKHVVKRTGEITVTTADNGSAIKVNRLAADVVLNCLSYPGVSSLIFLKTLSMGFKSNFLMGSAFFDDIHSVLDIIPPQFSDRDKSMLLDALHAIKAKNDIGDFNKTLVNNVEQWTDPLGNTKKSLSGKGNDRVIIQLDSQRTTSTVTRSYIEKYPGATVVQLGFDGSYRVVSGNPKLIQGDNIKWTVIGHGLDEERVIGNRYPNQLAEQFNWLRNEFFTEFGVNIRPTRIALAGCEMVNLNGTDGYILDFLKESKKYNLTDSVSGRRYPTSSDFVTGKKYSLNRFFNSFLALISDNKYLATFNEHGSAEMEPEVRTEEKVRLIVEDLERKRLKRTKPTLNGVVSSIDGYESCLKRLKEYEAFFDAEEKRNGNSPELQRQRREIAYWEKELASMKVSFEQQEDKRFKDDLKKIANAAGVSDTSNLEKRLMPWMVEMAQGITSQDISRILELQPNAGLAYVVAHYANEKLEESLDFHNESSLLKQMKFSTQDIFEHLPLIDSTKGLSGVGSNIDIEKLERHMNQSSSDNVFSTLIQLSKLPRSEMSVLSRRLLQSSNENTRNLGKSLSQEISRRKRAHITDGMMNGADSVFNLYETLNAVRSLTSSWSSMNATDRGLTLTELVGGVALPTVVSPMISKLFSQAGKALGKVGKAVKGGLLDIALMPITFTNIANQWKDFFKGNGDKGSLEFKSLLANTVITAITSVISIGMAAVGIAAAAGALSLSVSLGPIGGFVALAAFAINGIVQGALQIDEYKDHFDNTGQMVEQFFAAWVGIETDAFKKAKARKRGEESAVEYTKSLNDIWEESKVFLSDLFAKTGHKYLNVRDRVHNVNHGVIKVAGDYSAILQDSLKYGGITRITSSEIPTGSVVWAELGQKADANIQGDSGKKNLFNIDADTLVHTVSGKEKEDAFNLDADAQIERIDGGEGQDTLILNAKGGTVNIDTTRSRDNGKIGRYGNDSYRTFDVNSIENITITDATGGLLRLGDENNIIDVESRPESDIKVYGGGGSNVFILTNNLHAYSESNDIFVWRKGGGSIIHMVAKSQVQVALIELPFSSSELVLQKSGRGLKVIAPSHDTGFFVVADYFHADGTVRKDKLLQFKDKFGRVFSLNLANLNADLNARFFPTTMDKVAKSYLFQKPRQIGKAEVLEGDLGLSTYHFKPGSGKYVLKPRTDRMMTVLIESRLENIHYSYEGSDLIIHTGEGDSETKVTIKDYKNNSKQFQMMAKIPGAKASDFEVLTLPKEGSGSLSTDSVTNIGAEVKEAIAGVRTEIGGNGHINLSDKKGVYRYRVAVADLAGTTLEVAERYLLTYLRMGDDLVMYDRALLPAGTTLDKTVTLRVEGYFTTSPAASLTVNGKTVTGEAVLQATLQHIGTDGDDTLVGTNTSTMAGGKGHDNYRIDMSGDRTFVIDNADRDQATDTLTFLGLKPYAGIGDISVHQKEEDVWLTYGASRVVIKNYNKGSAARHLTLKIGGNNYVLPARRNEGFSFYEVQEGVSQRVSLSKGTRDHVISLPWNASADGTYAFVLLDKPITDYQVSVLGYDLILTGSKQVVNIKDYYRNVDMATFRTPDGRSHDTILPKGVKRYEALSAADVWKKDIVRYLNAGVQEANASQVDDLVKEGYHKEFWKNGSGGYQPPEGVFSYFTTVTKDASQEYTLLEQRDAYSGDGVCVYIDGEGRVKVIMQKAGERQPTRIEIPLQNGGLFRALNKKDLVVTMAPSSGFIRVKSRMHGYFVTVAEGTIEGLATAYRDGFGGDQPRTFEASKGVMMTGAFEPNQDEWDKWGFVDGKIPTLKEMLTAHRKPADVKTVEAVLFIKNPTLSRQVIRDVVAKQVHLSPTGVAYINRYLNVGIQSPDVMNEMLVLLFSGTSNKTNAFLERLLPDNLDVVVFKALMEEKASVRFIIESLGHGVDVITAQLLLTHGVKGEEIGQALAAMHQHAGIGSEALAKNVLRAVGYKDEGASKIAAIMAALGDIGYQEADSYLKVGVESPALVQKYRQAGVTAAEIESANRDHAKYRSGKRSGLINVSVGGAFKDEYYVYDLEATSDLDGGKIKRGKILTTEDGIKASNALNTGVSGMKRKVEVTGRGRSNEENLIDGFEKGKEAFAWAPSLDPKQNRAIIAPSRESGGIFDPDRKSVRGRLLNNKQDDGADCWYFGLHKETPLSELTLEINEKASDDLENTVYDYVIEAWNGSQWVAVSDSFKWNHKQSLKQTVALTAQDKRYDLYRAKIHGASNGKFGSVYKDVKLNPPVMVPSVHGGTVEFTMKDKLVLDSLTVLTEGGEGSAVTFRIQAQQQDGSWINVSSDTTWSPGSSSQKKIFQLDTNGIPYNKYRMLGVSGHFTAKLWMNEVEFETQSVKLSESFQINVDRQWQGSHAGESMTGTAARDAFFSNGGDDTLTGNGGADVYVFAKNDIGITNINNYDDNRNAAEDIIYFKDFAFDETEEIKDGKLLQSQNKAAQLAQSISMFGHDKGRVSDMSRLNPSSTLPVTEVIAKSGHLLA